MTLTPNELAVALTAGGVLAGLVIAGVQSYKSKKDKLETDRKLEVIRKSFLYKVARTLKVGYNTEAGPLWKRIFRKRNK